MSKKGSERDNDLISPDMTIMEIVQGFGYDFPEIIEIMQSYGLHCVGCGGAMFETLEQGVSVHGWSKDKLKKLVKELNEFISSN